jgi:hypothetical protein
MRSLHTPVSQETSLTVLLAALITTAITVVLPALSAIQAAPEQYFYLTGSVITDIDNDGIPDTQDVTPYGTHRYR